MSRIPKWVWAIGAVILTLAGVSLVVSMRFKPLVRERAIAYLQERFDCRVELQDLSVSVVFPVVRISGTGLKLHRNQTPDLPAFIEIPRFAVTAQLAQLFQNPRQVSTVTLENMTLNLPPRQPPSNPNAAAQNAERHAAPVHVKMRETPIVVGELNVANTTLNLLPRDPSRQPTTFEVHQLQMRQIGLDRPAAFRAELSNPKPPGEIHTEGTFGPWQTDDPSATPLAASYQFRNADLGVFKGISGILSSDGKFGGVLYDLEAQGQTATPNFRVTASGHPVDLKTQYEAVIDGTNGNTILKRVDSTFLHSELVSVGGVAEMPGVKGRTVSLDVKSVHARIEDLLWLAVKSGTPLMTGACQLHTKFLLPPNSGDAKETVVTRLNLDGEFAISQAHFTSEAVQKKIDQLNRRGLGQTRSDQNGANHDGTEPSPTSSAGTAGTNQAGSNQAGANQTGANQTGTYETTVSNLKGRFLLKDSVIRFSNLTFSVPGAEVQMAGTYGLVSERMDFQGELRMHARLSQVVGGWGTLLLKPFDRFFEKNGSGTVVHVLVSGTRTNPEFGVKFGAWEIRGGRR